MKKIEVLMLEFTIISRYEIMLRCWNFIPERRPSFSKLELDIQGLLDNGVLVYYIALNEPYVTSNKRRFNEFPDYLDMMKDPEIRDSNISNHQGYQSYVPMNSIMNS